jgi:hypothetical protein
MENGKWKMEKDIRKHKKIRVHLRNLWNNPIFVYGQPNSGPQNYLTRSLFDPQISLISQMGATRLPFRLGNHERQLPLHLDSHDSGDSKCERLAVIEMRAQRLSRRHRKDHQRPGTCRLFNGNNPIGCGHGIGKMVSSPASNSRGFVTIRIAEAELHRFVIYGPSTVD